MGHTVSREANDAWLQGWVPIQGEHRAFMAGAAASALMMHSNKFGLKWERDNLMIPLQQIKNPVFAGICRALSQFCSADVLVPYFALLYWVFDKHKCVHGIFLVPISEVLNGSLKWFFRVPRPGWADRRIDMKAYSHEFSFPSSHAQIIWALATFFSGTSVHHMRQRLYGSLGRTAAAYYYFLIAPYLFAFAVCVARVYEGVHYPRDVATGAGVGASLAALYMRLLPSIDAWLKSQPIWLRMILLQMFAVATMGVLHRRYLKSKATEDKDHAEWVANATQPGSGHEGKTLTVSDIPYASYTGMVGVLSGLAVGVPLAERMPLALPSSAKSAIARVVLGNALLLGTYFGIRVVEKKAFKDGSFEQRATRWARYASVPVVILYFAPALFKRLGL